MGNPARSRKLPEGLASAELNGKIYAIGGVGRDSVEIFDPVTNQWSYGD